MALKIKRRRYLHKARLKAGQCLSSLCSNKHKTRGLCKKCYAVAAYVVKTKKASWADLENLGLVAPKRTTKVRQTTQPFMLAFNQALKRKAKGKK